MITNYSSIAEDLRKHKSLHTTTGINKQLSSIKRGLNADKTSMFMCSKNIIKNALFIQDFITTWD
jgi:hypothetical protein